MVKKIQMNVNETLELDYLVEQVTDDAVEIDDEPSSGALSLTYISKNISVLNPTETGTYKLDINGQTVEIDVTDIPDSVILKPESGALNNFSGETDGFSVVNSPNLNDGPKLLEGEYPNQIISTSGLNSYPQVGYRHQIWIQPTENANPRVWFGVQDSSNYYAVVIDENNNAFRIIKDGSNQKSTSVTISKDTTYILDWDWRSSSPNIETRLFDDGDDPTSDTPTASLSFNDTEYTGGGIGFFIGRGSGSDNYPDTYFEDYWKAEQL